MERRVDIADDTLCDRMSSIEMRRIYIDLHDFRFVWIELPPGKVRSEHQQGIAIKQSMIAGLVAEHPRHANVVRIVVLKEVFCA
jgi:hypothetical protein